MSDLDLSAWSLAGMLSSRVGGYASWTALYFNAKKSQSGELAKLAGLHERSIITDKESGRAKVRVLT